MHELAVAPHLDEPHLNQDTKVVGHCRLRDRKLLAQTLACGIARSSDAFENREPARVGKRLRNAQELVEWEGHDRRAVVEPARESQCEVTPVKSLAHRIMHYIDGHQSN